MNQQFKFTQIFVKFIISYIVIIILSIFLSPLFKNIFGIFYPDLVGIDYIYSYFFLPFVFLNGFIIAYCFFLAFILFSVFYKQQPLLKIIICYIPVLLYTFWLTDIKLIFLTFSFILIGLVLGYFAVWLRKALNKVKVNRK